ncbi:MAG: hypothetical protein U0176_20670 [Bacteroidia bacterium]
MNSLSAHDILLQLVGQDAAKRITEDPDVEEFLQPLIYLGYLDRRVIDTSQAVDWAMADRALREMAVEASLAGFELRLTLNEGHWVPITAAAAWLQDLVSVEGEVPVLELPEVGSLSLWTRVLHFRLWVMGLMPPDAARQPWSADSLSAVQEFGTMLGLQTIPALEALGNLERTIDWILPQSSKFFAQHPRLAVFRFAAEGEEPNMIGGKKRFLKALEDNFGGTEGQLSELQRQIKEPSVPWLSGTFSAKRNKLLLRIVKVYQWINGYYSGELGLDFSKKSLDSLKELMDIDTRRDLKGLILEVEDGYWALNIDLLLKRIDVTKDEISTQEDEPFNFAAIGKELEANGIKAQGNSLKPDFIGIMGNEQQQRRTNLHQGYNAYCGSKSLMETAKTFLNRIREWLSNLWKDITGVAKNLAGLIFRNARRAYRVLADGMSLLLGRRTFQTGDAAVSDFDFDFDLVNFVDTHATNEDVETQAQLLRARTASLYTTLGLVGKPINFIMKLDNPIGWLGLGLKLADQLRELLRNPHPQLD